MDQNEIAAQESHDRKWDTKDALARLQAIVDKLLEVRRCDHQGTMGVHEYYRRVNVILCAAAEAAKEKP